MSSYPQMLASAALSAALVALSGCAGSEPDGGGAACVGKCDSPESRDSLLAQLDGFADPVAGLLREAALDNGSLDLDYRGVVDRMGATLGCDAEDERHYMVLTNDNNLPRSVITHCSNNPSQASRFFAAMSATASHGDIENHVMHLAGWDNDERRYRHYLLNQHPEGGFRIHVQPESCLSCHGETPQSDRWHPKMNELGAPWTGWNAEPGFPSHRFDENLAAEFLSAPTYNELADPEFLDSASNLEVTVRTAMDRANGGHLRQRRGDWEDLELTLSFLEPLFCDSSANYMSEEHSSGRLHRSTLLDESLLAALGELGHGYSYAWQSDTHLRLPSASASPLLRMPVRPELSVLLEQGLVSREVLDPRQLLQLRAIDWQTPMDSDVRCRLYQDGESRIMAGNIEFDFADLPEEPRIEDLLPLLFAEIMKVESGGQLISLLPADDRVFSLANAEGEDEAAALASGQLEAFAVSVEEFVAQLDAYVDAVSDDESRAVLRAKHQRSTCRLRDRELFSLPITDTECP